MNGVRSTRLALSIHPSAMHETGRKPSYSENGTIRSSDYSRTPKTPTTPKAPTPTIDTTIAMTVTPASAAVSAATSSSTRSSPKNQLHALKTQAISPKDQDGYASPMSYPSPSPSTLPSAVSEPAYFDRSPSPRPRPSVQNAMAEAMASNKSPGLIRRLSRGARQQLSRKASQQHSMRMRDQSGGPVLVRRRSDSNAAASDMGQDVSDLELDASTDNNLDDAPDSSVVPERHNGLGINLNRSSNVSTSFEGGIAPAISAILQTGTRAMKYNNKNKKNKRIMLWLDPNSARVCWHSSNPTKSFFIDDVRDVRVAAESRNARDDVKIPEDEEERWMTIVYEPPERSKGRTIKAMHLKFDSPVIVKYWSDALSVVTRQRTEVMNALTSSSEKSERSMAMVWKRAMDRKSHEAQQLFSLDDARWFCRKLEINCSDSAVRTHFTRSDTNNTGLLNYAQYQHFVNSFKERKDIQNLFRNINLGTEIDMSLDSFLTFLRNDQSIDVDKDKQFWEGVFDKFARPSKRAALPDAETVEGQLSMNMQGFQNFLASGYNSPLITTKVEATFSHPLNEYFISSSHNTYLLGRQFNGTSSVEPYIATLIKGCRCVEIDCWDGEGGRPMVTHGRTMTTKVPFEDCVSTIAKYAFHTSPYPLIVSLEVHCNADQQKAMVEVMIKYWKEMMITEPVAPNASFLPSPEELKNRILVKVKIAEEEYSHLGPDGANGRSRARSLGSAFGRTASVDSGIHPPTPVIPSSVATSPSATTVGSVLSTPRDSVTNGSTVTPSSSAEDSDENLLPAEKPKKRKTSKIIPELGKLGVYAQGIKFPGFDDPDAKTPNHIFSFNENTFNRLCTKTDDMKARLDEHNVHYLMRVYPKPGRIDSSNFNPLEVWRRGVQMAALNWQTYDVHQQVNEAMFAAGTDHVGYVLKPEQLRHVEKKDKKEKKFVKFSVDIISAQRLPRPLQSSEPGMNPYIEFEMYSAEDKSRGNARGEGGTDASAPNGYSGLGSPLRKRTKIIEGNGFDPIFNQPLSMTVMTKYPSLIFVRWTVWNSPDARLNASNNVLLATFTAKLDSLQQGYRHLPLFNPHGEQYRDAKLFVKIRKDNPIPLQTEDNAYGVIEPAVSPRNEPYRAERGWRSRVFSRNSSQRRMTDQQSDAGIISRTSSMDRESLR